VVNCLDLACARVLLHTSSGHARRRAPPRPRALVRVPGRVYAQALLEHAEEFADRLVEIARNGDDNAALRAIEALNNRVLGRPKETIEPVTPEPPADLQAIRDMTAAEREQLYRQLLAADGLDL
jgi:hypothetical protein